MVALGIFRYGALEIAHLGEADEALGRAIARLGMIERRVMSDLFAALIHCIVAQQISAKAAQTVWARMSALLGEVNPVAVSVTAVEALQACGLSMRKAGYIKGAAEAVARAELDLQSLRGRSDAEVVKELSTLPGIGVWTAEMLLIFALGRPDVVSWHDLAIRRGMMALYGYGELTRAVFDDCRRRYSPYGSVASLYLWALSVE